MVDIFPRRVVYFSVTRRVRVKHLRSLYNNTIAEEEVRYLKAVEEKPVSWNFGFFERVFAIALFELRAQCRCTIELHVYEISFDSHGRLY